jgi:hypothetical protein
MAKGDKVPGQEMDLPTGAVGGSALNRIEIPIPPESLKMGLRLVLDIKETKVRLQVETLVRWS